MQDTSKDKWVVYGLDQPFSEDKPIKLHTVFEHSLGHDTESSAIARAQALAAQIFGHPHRRILALQHFRPKPRYPHLSFAANLAGETALGCSS
jgi:hypothetical protein